MNASRYEQASAGLVSRMGYSSVEVYLRQDRRAKKSRGIVNYGIT